MLGVANAVLLGWTGAIWLAVATVVMIRYVDADSSRVGRSRTVERVACPLLRAVVVARQLQAACLLVILAAFLPATANAAAPGAPDDAFGKLGSLRPTGVRIEHVVSAPDDSFYVLGGRRTKPPFMAVLQHRLADGRADESFGVGGEVVIAPPEPIGSTWFDELHRLADGRLLLKGWTNTDDEAMFSGEASSYIVVARLNPDGTPDTSFSGDGFLGLPELDLFFGDQSSQFGLHPDPSEPGAFAFELTVGPWTSIRRYEPNGMPDVDFGEDGGLLVDLRTVEGPAGVGNVDGIAASWTVDSAGRWYAAGRNQRFPHCTSGPCDLYEQPTMRHAWRFLPDGSPDPGFGADGHAASLDTGRRSAIDPQYTVTGRLAITGGRLLVSEPAVASFHDVFTRWNADGTIDSSWGGDGDVELTLRSIDGSRFSVSSEALDARGRLVLALDSWGGQDRRVLRLTPDGWRDPTFDLDGSWMSVSSDVPFAPAYSPTFAVEPMPSGRMLWYSDRGSLECCPYKGRIDSVIGMLAGGEVAAPAPRLTLRVAARRCGSRVATACRPGGRGTTLAGVVRPIPAAGDRSVHLTVVERCSGEEPDTVARVAVQVDERGMFRHVLGDLPKARQRVMVVAQRAASGDAADARSRPVWLQGTGRAGACEE